MSCLIGHHLYRENWRWGLVLALPTMLVIGSVFFAAESRSSPLMHLLSFVLIPVGARTGIRMKAKRLKRYNHEAVSRR